MILACIAAMAENRVIGRDGTLPWRLASDLAHFRRTTMGSTIIMGRRTWESLRKALPGRKNVVLTSRPDYNVPPGVLVSPSLDEALERMREEAQAFVIGGGEVFRRALPLSERLHLTVVHAEVAGDTFFPELDPGHWRLVSTDRRAADARNEHAHSFLLYEREGVPGSRRGS